MKKLNFVFLGLFFGFILLFGCTQSSKTVESNGKLKVVASFYPMYDIAKNVGGESVDVSTIVPAGVEPHEYEPTSRQIESINQSDVVVILGSGMGGFENTMVQAREVVNASKGLQLLTMVDDESESGLIVTDPHVWLSAKNMIRMSENVRDALIAKDPKNENVYRANADSYIAKLNRIDLSYKNQLSNCSKSVILVNHNAFSYMAQEYHFRTIYISGISPESEPSPRDLENLVQEARNNSIKYIFYEELSDPRAAEAIASEVNATALELNPIEGTKNENENYISIMERNLINLKIALECK
ncbi:MAG: metal ABC transporter substrate-binding protein [Candidatus Bilamarchaeum sp.]